MGTQNIRDFNLCNLSYLMRRYHLDDNKIWKMIVDYKYDLSPNVLRTSP
jgi:predicted membrane protein